MASPPIHVPHNSSSGLKPSYEPQNLPDLINDLRKSECSDEIKLFVLNCYLHKCQEDLPVVCVPGSEPSEFRSMTLRGIEILKKEILRINKAIGLDVSATSMDFSAQDNAFGLMHCPNKKQIAKPSTNLTSSLFLNLGPSVEKGSASLFLQPKEKTVPDLVLKPLTQPIWKNNRRAWTDELHSRFVSVLQRLGGPGVATPKRIRDNMHVDGLTINQVKSHLQKYRLNWRESHPEGAAKKPEKLKAYYGAVAGTSEARGSSINMGNLG